MEEFVNETCDKLEYLLKQKELKLIQFFCVANELSVGNTYAMLAKDLDKFKKYHQMFWSEFKKRKLDLGLVATDGSGNKRVYRTNRVGSPRYGRIYKILLRT